MALVNVMDVVVLDNPTAFTNPLQFQITFECTQELQDDIEWSVVYVGNAEDSSRDQTLEEVMVGPVPMGINRFVLQADAPDASLIASQDLLGVTVVLVSCAYLGNRFVQIGYYVNNEYLAEDYDPENPPATVDISKLRRHIIADQPRVTRFAIDWAGGNAVLVDSNDDEEQLQQQMQADEGEEVLDLNDVDNEDDNDEADDDEDDDDGDDVDLAMNEEEDDAELHDDDIDNDDEPQQQLLETDPAAAGMGHDGGDAIMGDADLAHVDVSMEIMNEDSNSMDVARILQQQQ